MSQYVFWKACPELVGNEVQLQTKMIESAKEIGYDAFRNAVGYEQVRKWARKHGYELQKNKGPTLKHDPRVGFYRSVWGLFSCYYLVWSAQEHIWRIEVSLGHRTPPIVPNADRFKWKVE